MEKIKEDLTQPRFEVRRRATPMEPFMKMIKFPGSNIMHFDPDDDLIEKYKEEIDYIEEEVIQKDPQLANKLGGLWQKDFCGICYRSKANAVFMPCRHCEVCSRCAVRSTKFNGLCPFCRNVIFTLIFSLENRKSYLLQKKHESLEAYLRRV